MASPWLCVGDFNDMLWDFEKRGGRRLDKNRRRYLHEFLDKNELLDLGFQGLTFTQRGTRADRVVVQERLDRGLIKCVLARNLAKLPSHPFTSCGL